MKKLLIMTLTISVITLLVHKSNAQTANSELIAKHTTLDNASQATLASNISKDARKDNTTHVRLSPAKKKVSYKVNQFSMQLNYPTLQPQESFFADMNVSLNAKEKRYLEGYIRKYYENNGIHFHKMHAKANRYFSTITKVFAQYGVPEDLKYLAVIESNLNTNAQSYVGAVGTWQFMASTARLVGLTVNAQRDDRRDLYKSTVAAARYLSDLHKTFNNWVLVVAAYNSGPGRVKKAISSSNSDRFWDLKQYLPRESQNHVMKFLATAYIMNRFAKFFGVDSKDISPQFKLIANNQATSNQNLASISLSGKYSLSVIAKNIAMNLKELQRYNPGLIRQLTQQPQQSHLLYLPADKMITFKANQSKIMNESIELYSQEARL